MQYQLQVSENFLFSMCRLNKTAIRVYLALCYHKANSNKSILKLSHGEIRIIYLKDGFIGIGNDYKSFLNGIKELEELNLIEVFRSKNENGKPLTNRYKIH